MSEPRRPVASPSTWAISARPTLPAPPTSEPPQPEVEPGWGAGASTPTELGLLDDVPSLGPSTAARRRSANPIDPGGLVPRRLTAAASDLELRMAFILLHVDGASSLRDIAKVAALPLGEVITIVRELAALGMVALPAAPPSETLPPGSGSRRRA